MHNITRRNLLRFVPTALFTYGATTGCSSSDEKVNPVPVARFTDAERLAISALANAAIPPDDTPGGAELGALPYIERLCGAFDVSPPAIFAGGPFSGRAPIANSDGTPSTNFPPNDFAAYMPLDAVSDIAWRVRIFGSKGVPGGAPNDAILGEVVGLIDQLKKGLKDAIDSAKKPMDQLSQDEVAALFDSLEGEFRTTFVELVFQAAFGAPEYGGNPGRKGWKLANYEGDVQPLGYSIYSTDKGAYVERPDAPMSTANPGLDPNPLTADSEAFIDDIVRFLGGRKVT